MPALPPVPRVIKFIYRGTLGDDTDVVNRFFQQYTGAGPLSTGGALTWATAAFTAWGAHLAAEITTAFTLTSVELEDLSSSTGAVASQSGSTTGSVGTAPVTAGAALVVAEPIARRYRGGHPRQYIAGCPQADTLTPQTWAAAYLTGFDTAYTAFRAAVAAGCPVGLQPAVDVSVSYFQGFTNFTFPSGRVRPIPTRRAVPVVDVIEAFVAQPHIGSQRRRNL